MNKYISQMADLYALSLLHREKSKVCQFSGDYQEPVVLNSFKDFYKDPAEPVIFDKNPYEGGEDYQMGKFSFPSEIITPYKENNIAGGIYYENHHEDKASIIIVHGWRMDSTQRIERILLKSFMERKYNIYFITLPYHFDRQPEHSYNGEYLISANIDRTIQAVRQGVSDIRALLKWVEENEKGPKVLIGVSLGGLLANLAAVVDGRFDYLISLFYVDSLAFTTFNTIPAKYVRRDFEANNLDYHELKKYWDILQPSNFRPMIPRGNILLLSAKYDQYVAPEDSDSLYEAWGRPKRIVCECGHSGIVLSRGKLSREVNKFLDERI